MPATLEIRKYVQQKCPSSILQCRWPKSVPWPRSKSGSGKIRSPHGSEGNCRVSEPKWWIQGGVKIGANYAICHAGKFTGSGQLESPLYFLVFLCLSLSQPLVSAAFCVFLATFSPVVPRIQTWQDPIKERWHLFFCFFHLRNLKEGLIFLGPCLG